MQSTFHAAGSSQAVIQNATAIGSEKLVVTLHPEHDLPIELEIDLALSNFGVKRIIVGHTPAPEGIIGSHQGRLWRIDSAISRSYGGTPSYLEIVGDRVTAHKVPRPAGKPWSAP